MKAESKPDMKTKCLGNTDLFITPIGFGAWAIGGSGWELVGASRMTRRPSGDPSRARPCVNWIDTAAVYGMGHSEEVVASALRTWHGTSAIRFHQMRSAVDERATFTEA